MGEGEDPGADLVADAAVVGEGFVLGASGFGEGGGIVEADVEDAGVAGEEGA